jgi:hypothetical protein
MAAARKGGDPTISLAIEAHAIIMGIAFLILSTAPEPPILESSWPH